MNRDEAIQRAEVAMAWAKGYVVQYRTNPLSSHWNDMSNNLKVEPGFFRCGVEWRIRPKPLVCWAEIDRNGQPTGLTAWQDDKPGQIGAQTTTFVRMVQAE